MSRRACRTAPRTVSLPRMRTHRRSLLTLVLAMPAARAGAARSRQRGKAGAAAAGPKELGKFDDWIAATHEESGQTVCYAFTRAQEFRAGACRSRRGRPDRDRTPDGPRLPWRSGRLRLSPRTPR